MWIHKVLFRMLNSSNEKSRWKCIDSFVVEGKVLIYISEGNKYFS